MFRKGAYTAAYSGFEAVTGDGTGLAGWLRARGVTALDVVGLATDYCVRATAADAAAAGLETRVLLGLTAAVDPATAREALDLPARGRRHADRYAPGRLAVGRLAVPALGQRS